MAHSITLQVTGDDPRKVGKTKTDVSTHTFTLKDGCSIDAPVVSFSAAANIAATVNYAHIPDFGRYYWIRDRKSLVNGVVELTLESDPWESFQTQLKACPATITRSAQRTKANAYLSDEHFIGLVPKEYVTLQFPNELTDFSYVLMTVG